MRSLLICFSLLPFSLAVAQEQAIPATPAGALVAEGTVEPAVAIDGEPEAAPAVVAEISIPTLFQARIAEHSADEMLALLSRAEKISSGQDEYSTQDPVVLVLSGDEIELFKRENYRTNKALVDLAARLDAFNIVDVKVCTQWTAQRGIELTDLPPFIESVPAGDQEMKRLEKAGYAYF